jgi:spore germination protein
LLLPFVSADNKKLSLSIGGAFGCMTFIYTLLVLIAIAVLSAEAVRDTPYPLLEVIRGVQIPGTFVERLEVYFLLLWIPVTIDSYLFTLWGISQIMMKQYHYTDHRPWVLILAPILYTLGILPDSLGAIKALTKLDTWLGLSFSFVIIPISLILAWRQKRSDSLCKKGITEL